MFELIKEKINLIKKQKYINNFIKENKNVTFDFFGYISSEGIPAFSRVTKVVHHEDGTKGTFCDFVYPYFPETLIFCTERLDKSYTEDRDEKLFKELCKRAQKCFKWDETEGKNAISKCAQIFNKIKNGEALEEENEGK